MTFCPTTVERPDPDQPIERIEIRLESNITKPMVIGIQEVSQSSVVASPPNDDEASNTVLESDSLLPVKSETKPKTDEKKLATLAITVKRANLNGVPEVNEAEDTAAALETNYVGRVENYAQLPLDDDTTEEVRFYFHNDCRKLNS